MGIRLSRPAIVQYVTTEARSKPYRIEDLNDQNWYQENRTKYLIEECRKAISHALQNNDPVGMIFLGRNDISMQQKDAIVSTFHGFHIQFCHYRDSVFFLSKSLPKPPNFHCSCEECKMIIEPAAPAHPDEQDPGVGAVEEAHDNDIEWDPHGNEYHEGEPGNMGLHIGFPGYGGTAHPYT